MQPTLSRHDPVLDKVYGAISDPTRRAMLSLLAAGDANVGTLAERFPISFNGVSKHIKVLERAGLVRRSVHGREHWLRLNAEPLQEAAAWLEHYRTFWNDRLDALEALLVAQHPLAESVPAPARRAKKGRGNKGHGK